MNERADRGIGRPGRSVVRFGRSDVLFHSNNTCTRFHYVSGMVVHMHFSGSVEQYVARLFYRVRRNEHYQFRNY